MHWYTFLKFIKITPPPPPPFPFEAPLSKNKPPKRIKILKQKMSTPTTDTRLSDLNLLFSLYAYIRGHSMGRGRGGFHPSFLPQNVNTCTNKSWNLIISHWALKQWCLCSWVKHFLVLRYRDQFNGPKPRGFFWFFFFCFKSLSTVLQFLLLNWSLATKTFLYMAHIEHYVWPT